MFARARSAHAHPVKTEQGAVRRAEDLVAGLGEVAILGESQGQARMGALVDPAPYVAGRPYNEPMEELVVLPKPETLRTRVRQIGQGAEPCPGGWPRRAQMAAPTVWRHIRISTRSNSPAFE